MKKVAQDRNSAVAGSLIIRENSSFFNRLLFVTPDGRIFHYDKRHLFVLTKEPDIFTPGSRRVIVSWAGFRIFLSVCFDLRFPLWYWLPEMYDVILVVASWPHSRIQAWRSLLIARAIETQSYVIGVNRVGKDPHEHYSGYSACVDYAGNVIVELPEKEGVGIAELSLQALKTFRRKFPFVRSGSFHPLLVNHEVLCADE